MASQEGQAQLRVGVVSCAGSSAFVGTVVWSAYPNNAVALFVGVVSILVLLGIGGLLIHQHLAGWTYFKPYAHLGWRAQTWRNAGARQEQLELLDALHGEIAHGQIHSSWPAKITQPLTDAHAILGSPAWRDPWLRDHRLVIDPIFEAAEIIRYVLSVSSMMLEVDSRASLVPRGTATSQQYALYSKALRESLTVASTRAVALHNYRQQVHRLERILQDQHQLPHANALADRVMDVVAESARHELHARTLRQNTEQLVMIEQGLREITTILGGDALHVPFTEKNWQ